MIIQLCVQAINTIHDEFYIPELQYEQFMKDNITPHTAIKVNQESRI